MKRSTWPCIAATLIALPLSARAQNVTVLENEVIAPLAGRMYTPAPVPPTNFRGTDLGFTFKHNGQLRILFGDTWAPNAADQIGPLALVLDPALGEIDANNDDPSATICLSQTTSGVCSAGGISSGAVAKWYAVNCQLHPELNCPKPLEAVKVPWNRVGPPVNFFLDASSRLKPTILTEKLRGQLTMSLGDTPVAGFSNSPLGPGGKAFGIFYRGDYTSCFTNADCGGQGFECDTSLATKAAVNGKPLVPCKVGDAGCALISLGGLCVDKGSSMRGGSDASEQHVLSVVRTMQVGVADDAAPTQYKSIPWKTNRFMNPTVRVVESISNPVPADGINPASEKILIWGRPAFAGDVQAGRSAKLYFAYADMPTIGSDGYPVWTVHYLTDFVNNVPQFKSVAEDPLAPTKARALALSGPDAKPADASKTEEMYDIIQQMAVTWVPALQKWVMLYGGNIFPQWTNGQVTHSSLFKDLYGIDNPEALVYSPTSSIVIRTADKPWGPWTPPQNLFPVDNNEALAQIAPGGVLRSPLCSAPAGATPQCVPHELRSSADGFGNLYGVNIIDAWMVDLTSSSQGVPTVDLYWNVSTGDPYQVLLMRTKIRR